MVVITDEQWGKVFEMRDNFARKILMGKELFEDQKSFSNKIIKSVLLQEGHTFISQRTRQSGKTTEVARITTPFLLYFYFPLIEELGLPMPQFFNIGFFGPQEQQAKTDFDLLKDTLRLLSKEVAPLVFEEFSGDTVRIARGKYPPRMIYAFTASATSHPESKTLNLIFLEEAQDLIDVQVDKAILPMGASTNATCVWIGVAGYQKCRFWELGETLPAYNKVIVDYKKVLREHAKRFKETGDPFYDNYRKYIEKTIREIGEDSPEFKTQYLMQWQLEKGQFITYERLMECEAEYHIRSRYPKYLKLYAGIDWGKMRDSTVLTIMNASGEIVFWEEWNGDDYASQIEDIVHLFSSRFPAVERVHCDATGNQDMGVDQLRSSCKKAGLKTSVIPFKFNKYNKDTMYKNLFTLMTKTMKGEQVVTPNFVKFPAEKSMKDINPVYKERFIKQFCDLQKEIKQNCWHCAHPEGPNYHDDYCDSLALCCLSFNAMRAVYKPVMA